MRRWVLAGCWSGAAGRRDAGCGQDDARPAPGRGARRRLGTDEWFAAAGPDPHDAVRRRGFERRLWRHALDLVVRGVDLVVDFGHWSRPDRRRARDAARGVGAAVELHALDVPLEERWRRVERRNAEPGAVVISRAQLDDYERWGQPPDDAERATYDPAP